MKPPAMVLTEPQRERCKGTRGGSSKASSLSPDEEVQREDRDAAIEAVRKMTEASKGTPKKWGAATNHSMNITGTPRYDWDVGYDGIQGFATQLRNRVSEPPTPQGRSSLRQAGVGGMDSPKRGGQTPGGRAPPGAPDHDYRTCPGGKYLESQDPTQSQEVPKFPYCGWCQQFGHISVDCLAKYYDDSMKARFPPKGRKPRKPLRRYDCRRCGQKHPFNVYCPFVTQPPVIPGECKSCGAVTNVHDEGCQYVEVKDEIGICSFCGQLDHTYAQCPERERSREQ